MFSVAQRGGHRRLGGRYSYQLEDQEWIKYQRIFFTKFHPIISDGPIPEIEPKDKLGSGAVEI
jgi:hypothetical protein